ncbi:hypothetical protein [Nonomuraea zeae]|uniref:Uncharacterized protein n=1 Tax=Nonomuraea zeae TaxID=1642303 RepID=A0A5S4G5T5_9ACTN|nr:hypothetical protein [Nonomuraea zeae]TMR27781.1 hypothetical protein ETD85_38065 [Nonomuraea zeae]
MSVVGSNSAGPLTTRVGNEGAVLLSVGAHLLSMVPAEGWYRTEMFLGMFIFGTGTGIGTAVVAAAIAACPARRRTRQARLRASPTRCSRSARPSVSRCA